MQTNFLLGALKLSEPARMVLKRQPYDLIARHAINDHGNITPREAKANLHSMKVLGPIMSRYKADPTDPKSPNILIVTSNRWTETLVAIEPA